MSHPPPTVPYLVFSIDDYRTDSYSGFTRLLSLDTERVTKSGGVYVVLRTDEAPPSFLASSRGGHFKGEDPTVPVPTLEANWVPGCHTLYIGKANELQRRLKEYRDFGQGRPIGHKGGRYIWQLADAADLQVCWKPSADPRGTESQMLAAFVQHHGTLPFANLTY